MLKNILFRQFISRDSHKIVQIFLRHGHTIRGKRPGVARTLQQRLDELNYVDPELLKVVNIGLPAVKVPRSVVMKDRLRQNIRNNPEIEKLARMNQLEVNLEDVHGEWMKTTGPSDIKGLAEYYNIYKDLFGSAYFVPRVNLEILYPASSDNYNPVFYGNILSPEDAKVPPIVHFDHAFKLPKEKNESLWTLIMTTPDGHLEKSTGEYVHWLVTNITNGDVNSGDTIVPYLQPFPARGLGYHRYIFILYKQNAKVNFDKIRVSQTKDPAQRNFSTLEMYREHQNTLTPASLVFFQAEYDDSVRDVFHKVFDTSMLTFEYDKERNYIAPQKWFPLKRAFNTYMDMHRDPMEINKEFVQRKLAKTHPFDGPKAPLRFPMAHPIKNKPSWLVVEMKKERQGIGRINDYEDW
uniref:Large ribosomal subunit protein mL38 n=1 Tax=Nyssomyia neivai TaxID=330878 RepID=A0A1L8DS88_9DIPT